MSLFDELFDARSLYFDIFDRMIEAIYICDTDRNIIYLNRVAEQLDSYLLKDIKGKSVYEIYGLSDEESPMLSALVTERPLVNKEFSYYVNGKEVVQCCNSGPIYEEGRLIGAYTVQRDLTMYKNIMEENIALQRAISHQRSNKGQKNTDSFSEIIGNSKSFRRCVDQARLAAHTSSSVMLIGATGSGKEVFARAIHEGSDRHDKPFLALNCAAIPESLIESILFGTTRGVYTGAVEKEGILSQADGGTVFLDEINSMPLASQSKLLRVLEERKIMKLGSNKEMSIDIRVISSTNEDPYVAIRNGHMREDLFYRLSVVQIRIPPLRERKEDVPLMVKHFVDKYNKRFGKHVPGVDNHVMSVFMTFSWPGNIRQLKACIESSMNFVADHDWITMDHLPSYLFEDAEVAENKYRQWAPKWDKKPGNSIHMANKPFFSPPESAQRTDAPPRDVVTDFRNVVPGEAYGDGLAVPPISEAEEPHGDGVSALSSSIGEESYGDIMDDIRRKEKEEIIAALRLFKGNKTKAAASLGMSRQSLSYRLKKYGLY